MFLKELKGKIMSIIFMFFIIIMHTYERTYVHTSLTHSSTRKHYKIIILYVHSTRMYVHACMHAKL